MSSWEAWRVWDVPTALWLGWIAYFVVLESWALMTGQSEHTLTWHLRPFLLSHPLLWFVGVGAGCWGLAHFFFPAWEQALLAWLRSY